ncbi:DoxX family protein [Oceanobacillus piezotolerans]|uniref:DoxX family protein n=1 Tax=Oceanobacillus piezotolerans TaxID=2448030 RepID=A0A498DHH4_9BACI|nr:DoxX family protein [Oceanobacillus piezotolerans]RLL40129.1 DoxX family protein [Oceanobacillus piezotolerans]
MLSIIIQILLGLGFTMFGLSKFTSKDMIEGFKGYGYPAWFRMFTGAVELLAAVLLIVGIWNELVAAIGGLFVVGVMVGAVLTHIKIKDEFKNMVMPIILLILGGIVLSLNAGSLIG